MMIGGGRGARAIAMSTVLLKVHLFLAVIAGG